MGFIDITTNNLSRELTNSTTYIDNWAFVPGTTLTGDPFKVHAFTSLEDFKSVCGTASPEGSLTYEYVAGLLSAGIPVLFKRIAYVDQSKLTQADVDKGTAEGVKKAKVILSHTDAEEAEVQDIEISEKFGGTFGNDINITIKDTGSAYYLEAYLKSALLEKVKLLQYTVAESADTEAMAKKLIAALQGLSLERLDVKVLESDPTKFQLPLVSGKYLTGGADFDQGKVAAEIPSVYSEIKDRLLYQPKFITSGGYTDADMTKDASIANAMKELTKTRQDCRAIIDAPVGTTAESQFDLAQAIAYTQSSDSEIIPSASMYAPWIYMQVGTTQLWMPPSYVFLTVMGNSLSKGGKPYTPKAGVTSGQVNNIIKPQFEVGSDLCDEWQADGEVNVNPIMKLQSGKYIIAGNSTLLKSDADTLNAFQESSVDLAVIEIRRYVYNLGMELQYQYNSHTAFETFALNVSNFLNGMVTEGAVTDFAIYNMTSNSDPRTLKIRLDVYLTPTIKKIEILLNVSYGSVEVTTGGES